MISIVGAWTFPGGGSHSRVIRTDETEIGIESFDGSGHEVSDNISAHSSAHAAIIVPTHHA